MIVGVLREIKPDEYRVGMVPADVEELVSHGPDVIIEKAAGLGSGLDDEACARLGAGRRHQHRAGPSGLRSRRPDFCHEMPTGGPQLT